MCIGRTSKRLKERIRQHVPKFIRNKIKSQTNLPGRQCKSTRNALISGSTIGQRLLDNKTWTKKFDINLFSVLAKKQISFYLATLEATFIESLDPSLCCQKNFVDGLQLLACGASERITNRVLSFSNQSEAPLL